MNFAALRSKPVFATVATATVALACMVAAPFMNAQSGRTTTLAVVIAVGMIASFIGAAGGLLLANSRRNVMWILALAVSMTAMLALLATALVSFAMK
ncbi:MAG: hypothetical protein JSS33_03310 [Proteobacteria bacterium]|nr:hypothetical protein [Pseudomonadota bacterium]